MRKSYMWFLSGLIQCNCKALPGRAHGERLPTPFQTWYMASTLQFSGRSCSQGLKHAGPAMYICTSLLEPRSLHQDLFLRGPFFPFWLSISSLLTLLPLPTSGPWVPIEVVSSLFLVVPWWWDDPPLVYIALTFTVSQCHFVGKNSTLVSQHFF